MSESPTPEMPERTPAGFDTHLFPSRHRPWRQWLLDHNPCLLLSTVLMLLGCFLVNYALRNQDSDLKLTVLVIVVNLYELCIIPLGLTLIRRTRGTARDGWWLLLFEGLFLVNATFINADLGQSWGIILNIVLFIAACLKAGLILHGLNIGLHLRTIGFFAVQLAFVYGVPIFLAHYNDAGVVSAKTMYALWWLLGLMPLAYDQLARLDDRRRLARGIPPWDLVQQVVRRVYLIAPWLLSVAQLRFDHWAHYAPCEMADYSPILLGLAVASTRLPARHALRGWAYLLPALALLLAAIDGDRLAWTLRFAGESHAFNALQITFGTTAIVYGKLISQRAFLWAILFVTAGTLAFIFKGSIEKALRWLARHLADALPTSPLAWGIIAIVTAFVLLAVGSVISLRRTSPALHSSG